MQVADGKAAGLLWIIHSRTFWRSGTEKKRKALLDYSEQDTLGLVKILELFSS